MDYITFPFTRFTLKISNWQSSHTSLQCKHSGDWRLSWVPLSFVALLHHSHKSCINNHTWLENTVTLFKMCCNCNNPTKGENLRFQQYRIIALMSAKVSIFNLFTAEEEKEQNLGKRMKYCKIKQLKPEPFGVWSKNRTIWGPLLRRGLIFLSSAFHYPSKLWTEKCEVPVIDTDLFQ